MNRVARFSISALVFVVLLAALAAWLVFPASAPRHFVVDGQANIFGAGHPLPPAPGGFGAGKLPPQTSFAAAPGRVLRFHVVAGSVDFGGGLGVQDPDGFEVAPYGIEEYSIRSTGGIAGFRSTRGGFLAGVFLDDARLRDPAPEQLDFTAAGVGIEFAWLAPRIGQVFFIGDGYRGRGQAAVRQEFAVPPSATRLYLGFADFARIGDYSPGGYGDNKGAVIAVYSIVRAN